MLKLLQFVGIARDLRQPPPRVRNPQVAPTPVSDDDQTREPVSV
jgi:hypothetical protein